jgi:hypothetical protein
MQHNGRIKHSQKRRVLPRRDLCRMAPVVCSNVLWGNSIAGDGKCQPFCHLERATGESKDPSRFTRNSVTPARDDMGPGLTFPLFSDRIGTAEGERMAQLELGGMSFFLGYQRFDDPDLDDPFHPKWTEMLKARREAARSETQPPNTEQPHGNHPRRPQMGAPRKK